MVVNKNYEEDTKITKLKLRDKIKNILICQNDKNIKEYKDKKKRLIDLDKYYYDLNTPKVDDSYYDILKKRINRF